MVEQLGTGVQRILDYYPRSIYQFTANFMRLVFPYAEGFEQVTGQASGQAETLLQFCSNPRSTKEMMQHLGLNHRENFRDSLLLPLIEAGKLTPTIPDKPSSPKQRYVAAPNPPRKN